MGKRAMYGCLNKKNWRKDLGTLLRCVSLCFMKSSHECGTRELLLTSHYESLFTGCTIKNFFFLKFCNSRLFEVWGHSQSLQFYINFYCFVIPSTAASIFLKNTVEIDAIIEWLDFCSTNKIEVMAGYINSDRPLLFIFFLKWSRLPELNIIHHSISLLWRTIWEDLSKTRIWQQQYKVSQNYLTRTNKPNKNSNQITGRRDGVDE